MVVFRATVLSVVLMFGAGPSVSLFCKAWCDPQSAAASGCHHEDSGSSTSVTSDHTCQDTLSGSAVLLKEDPRGRASSGDAGSVVVAAQFQFASMATSVRQIEDRGRAPTGLKRLLNTPLRI